MAPRFDQLRRNNHYVAAGYLAAFTPERSKHGSLWVYSRTSPTPFRNRPVRVAMEKDLYLRGAEDKPDDSVERFFASEIESPFLSVRDRLVYGGRVGLYPTLESLTDDEWAAVCRYVAFQYLRTPTERDAMRWVSELGAIKTVQEHLEPGGELRRILERAKGAPLDAHQIDTWTRALVELPSTQAIKADWLRPSLRNADRLAATLRQREWRLITGPTPGIFVTCDMPVVCALRGDSPGSYSLGGGWFDAQFEATLALSPSHALYVANRIPDERVLRTEAFTDSIRHRTIANAQRWVYSRESDENVGSELRSTERPCYYIQSNGVVYAMGHSMEEIEREARKHDVGALTFRYGVPPR